MQGFRVNSPQTPGGSADLPKHLDGARWAEQVHGSVEGSGFAHTGHEMPEAVSRRTESIGRRNLRGVWAEQGAEDTRFSSALLQTPSLRPQEDKASRSKHLRYADQVSGACSTAKPGPAELLCPDRSRVDMPTTCPRQGERRGRKGPRGFKPDRPR